MMTQEPNRSRPAPAERFAGDEHVFDLSAAADQLRSEGAGPHGHQQVTPFKHPTGTMALFAFQPGRSLPEHKTKGFVTIQVVRGRLAVKTPDNDHDLHAGQVLVMAPSVPHSVTAGEEG